MFRYHQVCKCNTLPCQSNMEFKRNSGITQSASSSLTCSSDVSSLFLIPFYKMSTSQSVLYLESRLNVGTRLNCTRTHQIPKSCFLLVCKDKDGKFKEKNSPFLVGLDSPPTRLDHHHHSVSEKTNKFHLRWSSVKQDLKTKHTNITSPGSGWPQIIIS